MRTFGSLLALSVLLLCLAPPAHAADHLDTIVTRLRPLEEVPAISGFANARFSATVSEDGSSISYTMSYSNLQGNITQSHIHIGQRGVNGGVVLFFCSNLGNGPAGTQTCPPSPGTISGTLTAANIVPVNQQGIAPGDFHEILRAIKAGVAYANIHTDQFPGGELRGQLVLNSDE
ncbi:MAG TPA: CHRD domain-containing protein [Thermoanaerobaculia bacterium]